MLFIVSDCRIFWQGRTRSRWTNTTTPMLMRGVLPSRSRPSLSAAQLHSLSVRESVHPAHPSTSASPSLSTSPRAHRDSLGLVDIFALLDPRTSFDPVAAWTLYNDWLTQGAGHRPPPAPHFRLQLIERFLAAVEPLPGDHADLDELHTWGLRLHTMIQTTGIPELGPTLSPYDARRLCFSVRVHALLGEIAHAMRLVRQLKVRLSTDEARCWLLDAYRALLVAVHLRHDGVAVLDLVVQHWDFLSLYMGKDDDAFTDTALQSASESLRHTAYGIVAEVSNGAALLAARERKDEHWRLQAGEVLILAYCADGPLEDAHAVVCEMHRQRLPLQVQYLSRTTRALARANLFSLANEVFALIPPSDHPPYHSLGLYLSARQGDITQAEAFYHKLSTRNKLTHFDNAKLMHAYAVADRPETVVELFNELYPSSTNSSSRDSPSLVHYTTLVFAHARRGDVAGLNYWLSALLAAGHTLDAHVYSIVLDAFAERGDVDSIVTVLDEMRAAGVLPSRVHYTSVISLLARRRDVSAAEAVYKRALDEGVVPDRIMITALMNAHVEAGSWEGVVRIFDYFDQHQRRRRRRRQRRSGGGTDEPDQYSRRDHRLTIDVYNTLLKAYVLVGTPFRVVVSLLRRLRRTGMRPDCYTYALAIQSACDADEMEAAERLFEDMEACMARSSLSVGVGAGLGVVQDETGKAREGTGTRSNVAVYALTILLAARLRLGHTEEARALLAAMRKRGLRPTSITIAHLVAAYARERTPENLAAAETMLQKFVGSGRIVDEDGEKKTDDRSTRPLEENWEWARCTSVRDALEQVHHPLMAAYGLECDIGAVERVFGAMLDSGGEPTLATLTVLLDVYRRVGDVGAVRDVWARLWDVAVRSANVDGLVGSLRVDDDGQHDARSSLGKDQNQNQNQDQDQDQDTSIPRHSSLLCLPLSIYIDALSAAGDHTTVPTTWLRARRHGFAFDAHNWNHLVVALVRAAEVERAFEVVERVILPYRRAYKEQCESLSRGENAGAGAGAGASKDGEVKAEVEVEVEVDSSSMDDVMSVPGVDDPVSELAKRHHARRVGAVRRNTKRMARSRSLDWYADLDSRSRSYSDSNSNSNSDSGMNSDSYAAGMDADADTDEDTRTGSHAQEDTRTHETRDDEFVHPLDVLHHVLPSWNGWRPHRATLDVLAYVLRHLRDGRMVRPVGVSTERKDTEDSVECARRARETLGRIYHQYPSAVRAVMLHDRAVSRQSARRWLDDGWG